MKTLEQYLEMPYHVSVVRADPDEDPPWAARVEELPECTASGRSPEEAVERVRSLMSTWIADALEADRAIPEPRQPPSGRLLVRMPRTLHAELARMADTEGVSLNQLITSALASSVSWRQDARNGQSPAASAPEGRRARMLTLVLVVNLAVLGIAAAIAVAALLSAW